MRRVKSQDVLSMKLMHYFIVNRNYKPIIINGIENEIWLENNDENYKIIRIVLNKIINIEQYNLDLLKTQSILSQIKKKTLSLSMKVLSFYMYMDEDLVIEDNPENKFKYVRVEKEKDIYENEIVQKEYIDIKDNMVYEEKDTELFAKIASDISDKNIKESEKSNNMFSKKNDKIMTIIFAVINIIVFALMYIIGNGSENKATLLKFGANMGMLTKNGDYYRLITCAFLHIGVVHLLCNLYSLFIIGQNIEYFFGKLKFVLIYFYSAITASLFVLIFQSDNTITAGASGAIFGLMGALLYFGYTYRGYIGNKIISSALTVIAINLAYGFVHPGISNAAHIGGLVGGLAISYMLGIKNNENKASKISGTVIVFALTGFLVYMAFFR
ncbi:MAG: rhomboid family intramembrane serine protease [Bacilli bacterium]|nr:rhomboid family intramembrane serine protease [Bacilli bacterium]